MDQILLDLREARAYLATHTLHKDEMVPSSEIVWYGQPCCAVAALRIVITPGYCRGRESSLLDENRIWGALAYLNAACPGGSAGVFNDRPSTIKQDVLDAYDQAIKAREIDLGGYK